MGDAADIDADDDSPPWERRAPAATQGSQPATPTQEPSGPEERQAIGPGDREPWAMHLPRGLALSDHEWPTDLDHPNSQAGYEARLSDLQAAKTSDPFEYFGRTMTPQEHDDAADELRRAASEYHHGGDDGAEDARREYLHALADKVEEHGARAAEIESSGFGLRAARRKAVDAIRQMMTGGQEGQRESPEDSARRLVERFGGADELKAVADKWAATNVKIAEASEPMNAAIRDYTASAKTAAEDPHNLGMLGELGLLTPEEQQGWLRGERVAADQSLEARKGAVARADRAADIFAQGAPGKPMHPWIRERQEFANKALADAQQRVADVNAMEAGERPLATKSAWRAGIEQAMSGAARGGSRITVGAEMAGEVQRALIETAGGPADSPAAPFDTVVLLGDAIAAKAKELFPGDPARQHEVGQVLANRAASMLGLAGTIAGMKWWQGRGARKAATGE